MWVQVLVGGAWARVSLEALQRDWIVFGEWESGGGSQGGEDSSPQGCEGVCSREPLPHRPVSRPPQAHPGLPPGSPAPLDSGAHRSFLWERVSASRGHPANQQGSPRGILFHDSRTV